MNVREKLVELLDDIQRSGTGYFGSAIENKKNCRLPYSTRRNGTGVDSCE